MKTLFIGLLLVSSKAFGWGATGHRVVGIVAEKLLDPAVAVKILEITKGQSLARVSTWADEIKSAPATYSHTYNWHFTDWKDEDHEHDETNSTGKLVTSIRQQTAILKDPKSTPDQKDFAIKFLVHLVGDIHMPLHVGNGLDRGGNSCRVTFHGKSINLHQLWDEGMIDFNNLSFTEISNFITQGKAHEDFVAARAGDVIDWARESKAIRATLYPNDVNPPHSPISIKQYCRTDIVVPQQEMPKLGFEYSYKFMPVIEKRLFQAGVRLATLLNQTLK